uniref:Cadherin domain-containing protein n=1 Tax=Serinus canaria TaxID=9135 RepID=A0A8C9UF77_SERCA
MDIFRVFDLSNDNVHFEIDSLTGDLYLSKELDYETDSHFLLQVIIKDYNHPPQNSTVFLSIDVEDKNDHSPHFQDDIVVIGIEENVPIGTLVYTFNAKDGDGGFLNSKIEYSLEISNAEDQAINLTDRHLDSLVGFLVHHVVAKDPDEGRNGQVTYHILSGNENKAFVLDKITGTVTSLLWGFLSQFLDREVQECYSLTVMALDDGSPALSATQVLTIIVLDVNDETPRFLKQLYETAVHENRDPGEFVVRVEAVDRDAGRAFQVYWVAQCVPACADTLGWKDISNFTLVIECHDLGSPSRSSTAQLYLTVLDENDHSPLFAKTHYQISVTEDLEEGSAILDLSASDEDAGLNGERVLKDKEGYCSDLGVFFISNSALRMV